MLRRYVLSMRDILVEKCPQGVHFALPDTEKYDPHTSMLSCTQSTSNAGPRLFQERFLPTNTAR